MPANHGTHSRYSQGCRCDACREGHRLKARAYKERKEAGQVRPRAELEGRSEFPNVSERIGPGPVEVGVEAEIGDVAGARPGVAAVALAMARLLDDPKARNQAPAAAKVLVSVLDKLCATSARQRRGGLSVVREMTKKDGA